MSEQTDEVAAVAQGFTQAMTRLVRAMDACGNDGEAVRGMSESVPESLEELAGRISAALGFDNG